MADNRIGPKTERSGALAEQACLKVFGMAEPNIEVKAVAAHGNHAVLKLSQLERSGDKDYVFVVYHRQHSYSRGRKGRPVCKLSIEQAFQQPLEFVVVSGATLCRLVIGSYVRFLPEVNGPSGHFYVYPALRRLREAALGVAGRVTSLENGHRLVGQPPRATGAIREARQWLGPSLFAGFGAGEPPF